MISEAVSGCVTIIMHCYRQFSIWQYVQCNVENKTKPFVSCLTLFRFTKDSLVFQSLFLSQLSHSHFSTTPIMSCPSNPCIYLKSISFPSPSLPILTPFHFSLLAYNLFPNLFRYYLNKKRNTNNELYLWTANRWLSSLCQEEARVCKDFPDIPWEHQEWHKTTLHSSPSSRQEKGRLREP